MPTTEALIAIGIPRAVAEPIAEWFAARAAFSDAPRETLLRFDAADLALADAISAALKEQQP